MQGQAWTFTTKLKANSHIPCCVAKGLDCVYTMNKKNTGCYLTPQTKFCNTENTNKLTLASCTHNMQYSDGCHLGVMSVEINTQTLSDITIHFIATQLHCFGPLRNNCQAVRHSKKKKGTQTKSTTSFVLMRSQKLQLLNVLLYCIS
jgi:hypothetical protein